MLIDGFAVTYDIGCFEYAALMNSKAFRADNAADSKLSIPTLPVREPAARLGVVVLKQLTEVIVTGVLKPGELLPPEGPLTSQFGVSRTVIRESIKRLEEKGLVTVSQGRGTTVNTSTEWNLLDPIVLGAMIDHDDALGILDEVSRVRAELESSLAADAASARSEDDLGALRDAQAALVRAIDAPEDFARADRHFHALVMEVSRNRLAPSIARTLFNRAFESRRFHGRDPEDAFDRTVSSHQQILDAIEEGLPETASKAMYDHIEGSWQRRRLGPRT